MMIKMAADSRRGLAGKYSNLEPAKGLKRLVFPLAIVTTLFTAWVIWRYIIAAEAVIRLPVWLLDLLSLMTGAGFLTLVFLWLMVGWQARAMGNDRQATMTLEELISLSPRDFEHYVAHLFTRRGFAVTVRGRSGDLGVDLEITQPDGRRAIVQCKRYRHAIGPDIVRELFGTMVHEMVHHGFLVTTAEISTAAREWAKGKPITLIDGPTLVRLASS